MDAKPASGLCQKKGRDIAAPAPDPFQAEAA